MKQDNTPIDPTWMEQTGGYARDKTLRDEFAGRALGGLINYSPEPNEHKAIAELCYSLADAMLKARAK
jgi:hypothetical protein